jgi:hypothetical protein
MKRNMVIEKQAAGDRTLVVDHEKPEHPVVDPYILYCPALAFEKNFCDALKVLVGRIKIHRDTPTCKLPSPRTAKRG